MMEQIALIVLRSIAWIALIGSILGAIFVVTGPDILGSAATGVLLLIAVGVVIEGALIWSFLYVVAGAAERIINGDS